MDDGEGNGKYYDDSVYQEVNNYNGESMVLTLAQDMSLSNFGKLMTGGELRSGRETPNRNGKKSSAHDKFSQFF